MHVFVCVCMATPTRTLSARPSEGPEAPTPGSPRSSGGSSDLWLSPILMGELSPQHWNKQIVSYDGVGSF